MTVNWEVHLLIPNHIDIHFSPSVAGRRPLDAAYSPWRSNKNPGDLGQQIFLVPEEKTKNWAHGSLRGPADRLVVAPPDYSKQELSHLCIRGFDVLPTLGSNTPSVESWPVGSDAQITEARSVVEAWDWVKRCPPVLSGLTLTWMLWKVHNMSSSTLYLCPISNYCLVANCHFRRSCLSASFADCEQCKSVYRG